MFSPAEGAADRKCFPGGILIHGRNFQEVKGYGISNRNRFIRRGQDVVLRV